MAKRKGKSQRRVKDWQQQFDSGMDVQDAQTKSRHASRGVKVPAKRAPEAENLDALVQTQGMVTGLFPGGAAVRVGVAGIGSPLEGTLTDADMLCQLAGTFRAPEGSSALAVGDIVTVALARHADAAGSDKDRADGVILDRHPRRTLLSRPQPWSDKHRDEYATGAFEKVIVANMDVLLVVVSTRHPTLRRGIIDRFGIIAQRGGLRPVLVVNKIDLAPLEEELAASFIAEGMELHLCSAASGAGIEKLKASLAGVRSVLAGASGVGKSSLLNAMMGSEVAVTNPVRMRDKRGRHTTSTAKIYRLGGDGMIVDTPGVRELGMSLDPHELPWYFPEFEPLAPKCHFRDCTHTHEPSCAVISAAEAGLIPPHRYESYLRLLETIEE